MLTSSSVKSCLWVTDGHGQHEGYACYLLNNQHECSFSIVSRVAVRIPVGCNLGQKALRFQRHALNRITGKVGVIRSGRVLSYMRNNEMFHRNIPKK